MGHYDSSYEHDDNERQAERAAKIKQMRKHVCEELDSVQQHIFPLSYEASGEYELLTTEVIKLKALVKYLLRD